MFETSPTTALLDVAFAKAQAKFKHAIKSGWNPHFKTHYAKLADVIDATRDALAEFDVHVTQWVLEMTPEKQVRILTRIAHKGEFMQSTLSLPITKFDAQGAGSSQTYGRRYAMAAALGIADEDDDDANAATGKGPAYTPTVAAIPSKPAPPRPKPVTPDVYGIGKNNGWSRLQIDHYIETVSGGTFKNLEKLAPAAIDKLLTTIQAMSHADAMEKWKEE